MKGDSLGLVRVDPSPRIGVKTAGTGHSHQQQGLGAAALAIRPGPLLHESVDPSSEPLGLGCDDGDRLLQGHVEPDLPVLLRNTVTIIHTVEEVELRSSNHAV